MVRSVPAIPFNPGPKSVLVKVTIAVMKYHDQSKLGRKGFVWFALPHQCSSLTEVRAGTHTGRESGGRSGCRSHEGVLLTGLLSLLSYRPHNHQPKDRTTHSELDSPINH